MCSTISLAIFDVFFLIFVFLEVFIFPQLFPIYCQQASKDGHEFCSLVSNEKQNLGGSCALCALEQDPLVLDNIKEFI